MATLYDIDARILDCVDTETGEVISPEKLDELIMERNQKLENVALFIKNLESDAAAIKAERDSLDKRMKSAENKAKSLREWLSAALETKPFETARVRVSFRKSTVTEVNTDSLPKKWCVKKVSYTPDKAAIKAALLAGTKIRGASLTEHQNLQIK